MLQAIGGSELNVACAAARIGLPAAFASVLPNGPLGDGVLAAAHTAGVATDAVKRCQGDVGTLHVVCSADGKPQPHYQRHRSAFCEQTDAAAFDWDQLVTEGRFTHVHLTGITPVLTTGAKEAWLGAAAAAERHGLALSIDLNHRPALAPFDELWRIVAPLLGKAEMLVLSEGNLRELASRHALPLAEPAEQVMPQLVRLLGVSMLGCCFKASHGEQVVAQRRWSVVATKDGLTSTRNVYVVHEPREPLGGGDAWFAGFLSSWSSFVRNPVVDGPTNAAAALGAACRRGDLLAALHQETVGDISCVTADELQRTEAALPSDGPADLRSVLPKKSEASPPPGAAALPSVYAPSLSKLASVGGTAVLDAICASRCVPIANIPDAEAAVPLALALLEAGLPTVEVVLRSDAAIESIRRIAAEVPELHVGVGTVLSIEDAERAVRAGARFVVTPGLNEAVVEWCATRGMPIIPGVATATEVERALGLGLSLLKLFPAEAMGGVGLVKQLSAPYANVRWMTTGGINADNARSYLGLKSVRAVGGSWMIPPASLASHDYDAIRKIASDAARLCAPPGTSDQRRSL